MKMNPIPENMRKIFAATIIKEHMDDYSIVYIDPAYEKKAREVLKD